MKSTKLTTLILLGAAMLGSTEVQAQSQTLTWPAGTLTHTTSAPALVGDNDYMTTYSNWVFRDASGVSHYFNGASDYEHILIGTRWVSLYDALDATSTDGLYTLHATSTGTLGAIAHLYPHFRLLKVDYAPPGLKSSVDYGTTTVLGSKTSSTSTWSAGVSLGVTGSFFGNGGGFTVTATKSGTNTDSLTINKAFGWDWLFNGGPTSYDKENDGVNHDNDLITLLLNPHVIVTQSTATNIGTNYGLDSSDTNVAVGDMDLIYLTVGQIKGYLADPAWTPTGPLARAWAGTGGGVSKAELQQILQADPYSNDPTGLNTSVNGLVASGRYTAVGGQNIVYTPTSGGATAQKYTTTYETIAANETTDKLELKAEMKITGGLGIASDLEAKGTAGFLFVWSHQNLESLSTDTKQQTTVNIQSPAADYTGPQSIVMYQDNLFGSIMFAPAPIH